MKLLLGQKLAVVLFTLSISAATYAQNPPTKFVVDGDRVYVTVPDVARDILVTGDDFYPLNVIRTDLGLTDSLLKSFVGKKTLSMAEGFSNLLPFLRRQGVDAYGMDLWYEVPIMSIPGNTTGQLMISYLSRYGRYLKYGNAFQTKIASNTFDVVVSHQLVNNFRTHTQVAAALKEMYRILKPGGLLAIGCVPDRYFEDVMNPIYSERPPANGVFRLKDYFTSVDKSLASTTQIADYNVTIKWALVEKGKSPVTREHNCHYVHIRK